jgi:opacity protein-like surface antigen
MLLNLALTALLASTTLAAPAQQPTTNPSIRDLIVCKGRSLTDCGQATIQLKNCYSIDFDIRSWTLPANTQCFVYDAHNNCDTFNKKTWQHVGNTGYAGVPSKEKKFNMKQWSGKIKSLQCYEAPGRSGNGWSYVS